MSTWLLWEWRVVLLLQCFLIFIRRIYSILAVFSAFNIWETEGSVLLWNVPPPDYIYSVIKVMLHFLFYLIFSSLFQNWPRLSSLTAGWETGQAMPVAMLLHVKQNWEGVYQDGYKTGEARASLLLPRRKGGKPKLPILLFRWEKKISVLLSPSISPRLACSCNSSSRC